MHVLGTPPAFILSQDQTLHLIDSIRSFFFEGVFINLIDVRLFVFRIPIQFSKSFSPFINGSINISYVLLFCKYFFLFLLSCAILSLTPMTSFSPFLCHFLTFFLLAILFKKFSLLGPIMGLWPRQRGMGPRLLGRREDTGYGRPCAFWGPWRPLRPSIDRWG